LSLLPYVVPPYVVRLDVCGSTRAVVRVRSYVCGRTCAASRRATVRRELFVTGCSWWAVRGELFVVSCSSELSCDPLVVSGSW
jgi:hypothetical protein